jgi:hypothetical protein
MTWVSIWGCCWNSIGHYTSHNVTVCWKSWIHFWYLPLYLTLSLSALHYSRRLRLKCDGTRAETRFRLSAKRTSPFKLARVLVQSTTGSRGVRICGSNARYTMFRGSVKSTGYPLHSHSFPFTSPPVRHRVPSHFNWTIHLAPCCVISTCCLLL